MLDKRDMVKVLANIIYKSFECIEDCPFYKESDCDTSSICSDHDRLTKKLIEHYHID